MQKCNNCGASLSCGCQRKVASDSKSVCNNCIAKYEANLVLQRNKKNLSNALAPTINAVTLVKSDIDQL